MRFNLKEKKRKSKKKSIFEKRIRPKIGDIKKEIKFSYLPVKIDNTIIFLEKYQLVYEYKEVKALREVPMGVLEDSGTILPRDCKSFISRHKYYTYNNWVFIRKEIL